jgi:Protein of unknown function (DUF3574)
MEFQGWHSIRKPKPLSRISDREGKAGWQENFTGFCLSAFYLFELRSATAARAEQSGGEAGQAVGEVTIPSGCRIRARGGILGRTELFFGRARPDGSTITDGEFRRFLDDIITPASRRG